MKTVFCDWGTTNVRAFLCDHETVVKRYASATTLHDANRIGFEQVMKEILQRLEVPSTTPIRLSGMVSSKNGWLEVPYVDTPATATSIANGACRVESFSDLRIYGGVSHSLADGRHDVMRGEETQIFGLLQLHPNAQTICLPGTHSKWVTVNDQAIESFSTWMTGDFFHCLSEQTILKAQIESTDFDEDSFLRGVASAESEGSLLNEVFYLRTDYVFGRLGSDQTHSYLSGLLIGHELAATARDVDQVYLCGAEPLVQLYSLALNGNGVRTVPVSAEVASLHGLRAFELGGRR